MVLTTASIACSLIHQTMPTDKPTTAKTSNPKHGVITSVRLSVETSEHLSRDLRTTRVEGIDSIGQFVRKLVVDYVNGKLVYTNPAHRREPLATSPA